MSSILKPLCIVIALILSSNVLAEEPEPVVMKGVNLSGGEFSPGALPGIYNKDYIYPSAANIALFAAIKMNTIRVPFLWERLQPELNKPLDEQELHRLDAVVEAAKAQHIVIILDPHNYAKYRKMLIGSTEVPADSFANFWTQLAKHYKDEPHVIFGLMNEPNKQSAQEWGDIAQKAINAIRDAGAHQLILVPGTNWTGAHSWRKKHGKLSNAEVLNTIKDPRDNIAIEVHQYFDADYSGKSPVCISAEVGEKVLATMTSWLKETGHKGFLAEFGSSTDPVCLEALNNSLGYLRHNSDVWKGWTYWAGGAWLGHYMFSIQPPENAEHPQVSIIKEFLP